MEDFARYFFGIIATFQLAAIFLKLIGAISATWWSVLLPLRIFLAIFVLAVIIGIVKSLFF